MVTLYKEDHTMSTKELDSRAAEYFSIMETIEALQAAAEAIKDAMKAAMTEGFDHGHTLLIRDYFASSTGASQPTLLKCSQPQR